jgi:saccharopine dehydrogenase (NAD+, L-lysine-forming)
MKILIVGHGAVGSVLTKLLLKEMDIESIICVDVAFPKKLEDKKVITKVLDVKDEEKFVKYLNEVKPDMVVNSALPKFNLTIMGACLKAQVNYMDAASFWDLDSNPKARVPYKMEQLDYDKEFEKQNIFGLIETGVAPGLDNIMAAECASELEEVDYIKIRMVEDTGSKDLFFSWNKEWLLDEIASKPIVYENGEFKFVESFGGEEEFDFPEPIGKKTTYYFCQDEVGSIPDYVKTKKLDVKIYDNNIGVLRLLFKLGLASNKPIMIDGVKVKPLSVLSKILPDPVPGEEKKFPKSVFALSVEAIGKKAGKKLAIRYSAVFPNQEEIGKMNLGANFISYPTALGMKLIIMQIKNIKRRGVFPPEALPKEIREVIMNQLKENHVNVYKKVYTPN